jgi:hypothetical protein
MDARPIRLAARCRYLRMTLGQRPGMGLVNRCEHIVRDGMECVGPFLDDHETDCGLWELAPPQHSMRASS